jgi:uncharacterized protein
MPERDAPSELASTLAAFADGLAHGSRSPVLRTPADVGLEFEDVTYPSADGTALEAWFVPCTGSNRLVVSMHAFGFNRYGYPGHLAPWNTTFGPGNDTEVDFVRDISVLHENGYNVLTFDFRNHGVSAAANGNLASNNRFEARDVLGTLAYVRSRPELATMQLALFARCMGANATLRAAHSDPAAFDQVGCLVAPLLLSPLAFLQASLENAGLVDHVEEVDRRFHRITGEHLAGGTTSIWAPSVTVPTLTYGVRHDRLTRPDDLQGTFDALGAEDKAMFWIEDSTRRWDGYLWFQRHPERVLTWLDDHL